MGTQLIITVRLLPQRSGKRSKIGDKEVRLNKIQDEMLSEIRTLLALIFSDDNCSDSILEERQREMLGKLGLVFEDDKYAKIRPTVRRMFSKLIESSRLNFLPLVKDYFTRE